MKKLFTLFAFLILNLGAFAQGYNVEVCVTLTGAPVTSPITAILSYNVNGTTVTMSQTINSNVTLPYNFCFPAYLQAPDSGFFAYASGSVQLSNCSPAMAINYGQMISAGITINLNMQNCSSSNCGVQISPVMGTTMLQANATGVSPFTYSWDNGVTYSSVNTFTPPSSGVYCVMVIDFTGCQSTDCYTVGSTNNFCSVTATATPDSMNTGWVNFTSTPSGSNGPYTFSWVFSNGTTSNLQNPSINFNNNTGVNWGFVTVTDGNGCVSYYSVSVVLPNNNLNCNAYFSMAANYNTGTPGEIFFQDQSFAFNGVQSYAWDFGDNSTSTQANPNHTYATAGYYNVCLTITGSTGCTATWCTNVYVDPAWWTSGPFQGNCTAGFLIIPGPANAGMVNIINTSQGNGLSYLWDFGNGVTATGQTPFLAYTNSGTYQICLTITDSMGSCTDTFCDSLTIDSLGNVTRSPLSGNVGVVVYATAQPNDLLSVQNFSNETGLNILPNPSNGLFTLELKGMKNEMVNIEIIDINARVVDQRQLNNSSALRATLNLNHLPAGAYFLKATSGNQISTSRLMIQK